MNKKYPCKKYIENIPKISSDQDNLVNMWWENKSPIYKGKIKVSKCLEMIKSFLKEHPELAPNMDLHHEILFEIGAEALRTDKYNEYIDFLLWYRENCIEGYKLSGQFYDRDLIEYSLTHRQNYEEIKNYFDIYQEYPDHQIDELDRVTDSLIYLNQPDLCVDLLKDIYPNIFYSSKVMGADDFVEPIVYNCFYKYIKPNFTEKDMDLMIDEMKEISSIIPELEINTEKSFWLYRSRCMYYDDPELTLDTSSDISDFCQKLKIKFEVYLHESKNKKWLTAHYLSTLVLVYLFHRLETKNVDSWNLFSFDRKDLERFVMDTYMGFFAIKIVPSLSFIQSFYYFCEFLKENEYINDLVFSRAKNDSKMIFSEIYKDSKDRSYVTKYFEKFPMC